MLGVGIRSVDYLHSEKFLEVIMAYEHELTGRCFDAFAQLNKQLQPIKLSH